MEIDLLFFFKKKWKHMYFYLIHHLSVIYTKKLHSKKYYFNVISLQIESV